MSYLIWTIRNELSYMNNSPWAIFYDHIRRHYDLSSTMFESGGHRDDFYLGWPIAYSSMSPNGGRGVAGSQPMSTAVHNWAQINFGDLTPYLNLLVRVKVSATINGDSSVSPYTQNISISGFLCVYQLTESGGLRNIDEDMSLCFCERVVGLHNSIILKKRGCTITSLSYIRSRPLIFLFTYF
jgi:hypothetical protein